MMLYKFRDINGQGFINTQDIFINRRLFLPSVSSLNDPNEAIAEIMINNRYKVWGNQIEERKRRGIRVCSLTETNKSALMWSHYAGSHTGICIGIEVDNWKDSEAVVLRKVIYEDRPISVSHNKMCDFVEICSHKEMSWAYEKEWRFISDNQSFLGIDINLIKFIFLGAKFNKSNLQWITYWRDTYNKSVEIRQMYFVSCDYNLYDETEIQGKYKRI